MLYADVLQPLWNKVIFALPNKEAGKNTVRKVLKLVKVQPRIPDLYEMRRN